jgi:SAM-dependent methyltransferase
MQWSFITSVRLDSGKLYQVTVDLGCGYGDLLFFAATAGAWHRLGIDKEKRDVFTHGGITVIEADLEEWISSDDQRAREKYDIALCFSVLLYLEKPGKILRWMSEHVKMSFIECQYLGDGPGVYWLENDDDMREWLSGYWLSVKPIGHTLVKDRNTKRTIWMCE